MRGQLKRDATASASATAVTAVFKAERVQYRGSRGLLDGLHEAAGSGGSGSTVVSEAAQPGQTLQVLRLTQVERHGGAVCQAAGAGPVKGEAAPPQPPSG